MKGTEKGIQHLFTDRTGGLILSDWVAHGLEFIAVSLIILVAVAFFMIVLLFIIDVSQHRNAVRRNYPVLGRFRYLFIRAGEFFRQYFFAMDREEMPFNRAEREWVNRAANNTENTVPFGSTNNLNVLGTPIFVSCPFPTLDEDAVQSLSMEIGRDCPNPYRAASFFNISGMSYGALSIPAIKALSFGAKSAGCWLNTGEGGLSPYHLEGGCDIVFQIGTAKYGVRDADAKLSEDKLREIANHPEVKMFEIKLSQGAKPGKGGILPGAKVTPEIAKIRGIETGKDSVSPNRHPEIDSIETLLDFIARIKMLTGKPVGFKTVVGAGDWLDALCLEIAERGIKSAPDFITIDGGDGGTGAAPMPLMDNVGLSLREALPMVADILIRHGLKDQIRLIASGKLITPADVAWALCAGADFINSARGYMFALGCIQAMKCNTNLCPTGVTSHNPRFQSGLNPQFKSVRVANYCRNIMHEVALIAHACGVREPRALRRAHVRIVGGERFSQAMHETKEPSDLIKGS